MLYSDIDNDEFVDDDDDDNGNDYDDCDDLLATVSDTYAVLLSLVDRGTMVDQPRLRRM